MIEQWQQFARDEKLSDTQLGQFQNYCALLTEWSTRMNLTALKDPEDIIPYHFQDSLRVGDLVDCTALKSIADVGTGAGLPGIPLKIRFPHLSVILIEVLQKRITFLNEVIKELGLDGVTVCSYDWRTFIRQAPYGVDLFCARASLAPAELLRALRPSSAYRDARIIYFASRHWEPTEQEAPLVVDTLPYHVGTRQRALVLFGRDEKNKQSGSE